MSWFYHNRVWVWLYFGISAILNLVPFPTTAAIVFVVLNFVGIAGAIIAAVETVRHKPASCLKCIANVPINAAWLARKKIERLRFYHWIVNWLTIPKAVIVILAYLGIVIFGNHNGDFIQWVAIIPITVFWSFVVYNSLCEYTHAQLKSFCPYCKDDNGGGRYQIIDVPDPSGSKMA